MKAPFFYFGSLFFLALLCALVLVGKAESNAYLASLLLGSIIVNSRSDR